MKFVVSFFLNLVLCSFASCERERPSVNQNQARIIARNEIKRLESELKIEADKLPPFSERVDNGFDFWIEDESQNIWLFVHVSATGLPEVSRESLDKYRRNGERVWEDLKKQRNK